MQDEANFTLVPLESVQSLLSPYLNGGRSQEQWEIREIRTHGNSLFSRVAMTRFFSSPTDIGFHLSNLSGLEIVAQLRIIHLHLCLGLPSKTRELWFLKGTEKCIAPIREYDNILVNMTTVISRQGEKDLARMTAKVHDHSGGRFDYTATVLM